MKSISASGFVTPKMRPNYYRNQRVMEKTQKFDYFYKIDKKV